MAMIRRVCLPEGSAEYELVRTGRRDVLMKALPQRKTRVYAPGWVPLKELDAMVAEHWAEISAIHRALDADLARQRREHPLKDGATMQIAGRTVTLRRKQGARARAELLQEELWLTAPPDASEEQLRSLLKACLSRYALAYIRQRLEIYGPRIGETPGRVTVRDQKSRWGSCSSKRNLNFHWKLVLAPPEALDYVVVHELCHLREFSHSPKFWNLVESHFPEYAVWKKWLKDHGNELGV